MICDNLSIKAVAHFFSSFLPCSQMVDIAPFQAERAQTALKMTLSKIERKRSAAEKECKDMVKESGESDKIFREFLDKL